MRQIISAVLVLVATAEGGLQAKVDFQKKILPLLEEHCVKCHKAPYKDGKGRLKKPKAGLMFDSVVGIEKGSEDGPVLKAGKPNQSSMYTRTILPPDDDNIMPPKGDPLTKAQTQLIRQWILEGADFGNWKGNSKAVKAIPKTSSSATLKGVVAAEMDNLAKGLKPLTAEKITQATESGASIVPLSQNNPLLRVEVVAQQSTFGDAEIKQLASVSPHVSELILRKTAISDNSLISIGKMERLSKLDLSYTAISGNGLEEVSRLPHLRSLNLFGTKVDDGTLHALHQAKALRHLYVCNTGVTEDGVQALKANLPEVEIIWKSPFSDLSARGSSAAAGERRQRKKK